ncbi:hypothetical protein [Acidocella aromatica]|uniref:Uncharacterized protein Yka (UPF0111/DUF47 family) n=1 Tax=Acidocella aromatica TaxID=1303579 RepID=A0A840VD39_9PROT|nr:hypothetical protein [Acidocella aromatica]MBB5372777.1 uncharacterized protein Yka (UPF0111/DUF47 family) [Acidocella aromatica]
MTVKSEIVGVLGESEVLLPGLISAALAANDRIKLRLSLMQEATAKAREPARAARGFAPELRAAGLDSEMPETALGQARLLGPDTLFLPGAGALLGGLKTDLDAMLAPLTTAAMPEAASLAPRVQALQPALAPQAADEIPLNRIAALTSASRENGNKFHVLVMDLHKALNQLAASTAAENLDGAMVHGLTDDDRHAVRAFMRGLHRTAPLAFGHPGLGTTAVHGAAHLTIQNDIGTTDAHVLVVHVTDADVTVTYTDIHRPRAKFFIDLFAGWNVEWSPLNQRQAKGLEEEAFYLINGRFASTDAGKRHDFLAFLGSRLVFLIDWNKARKALQIFLGKNAAIGLLTWAAAHDYGHRAFLELGGAELVYDAVHRAASGRIRYGERLDDALGEEDCVEFLRNTLRGTAQGLAAGRSARLIRDEIQAELSRRFETAESAVFTLLVRHLGLSRCIAEGIAACLENPAPARDFARRAKAMEAKADKLTAQLRELAARMQGATMLRQVIDQVENTTDALEDCAYLLGLAPEGDDCATPLLLPLAETVTGALSAMVRAVEAASRLPDGQRADATEALQAIDAVVSLEREADTAQREAFAELMRTPCADARALLLRLELTKALEGATDQLSHAAFALRDRVLEELSA